MNPTPLHKVTFIKGLRLVRTIISHPKEVHTWLNRLEKELAISTSFPLTTLSTLKTRKWKGCCTLMGIVGNAFSAWLLAYVCIVFVLTTLHNTTIPSLIVLELNT